MHHVNDLVISCIDFRFRDRVRHWIDETLQGQADHVALAGASKAFLDKSAHKLILNQIRLVYDLHGVRVVHLMHHIDCGAYGGSSQFSKQDDEIDMHREKLREAARIITKHFPDITVYLYLLDFATLLEIEPLH